MEMRAAAVQLNSTADKARNLETAERLVRAAASDGATLVVLPEKWNLLGDAATARRRRGAAGRPDDLAPPAPGRASWGSTWSPGSIAERAEGHEKAFNTSALIGPDGELEARYRKIHMFDVDVGGVAYRESEHEEPGDELVVTRSRRRARRRHPRA